MKFIIDMPDEQGNEFRESFTSLAHHNIMIAAINVRIEESNLLNGTNVPLVELKTQNEVDALNLKSIVDKAINEKRKRADRKAREKSNVSIVVT